MRLGYSKDGKKYSTKVQDAVIYEVVKISKAGEFLFLKMLLKLRLKRSLKMPSVH